MIPARNSPTGDPNVIRFTCIANGNSKMYRYEELKKAIEAAGFELKEAHHNIGPNAYSLLRFRKK